MKTTTSCRLTVISPWNSIKKHRARAAYSAHKYICLTRVASYCQATRRPIMKQIKSESIFICTICAAPPSRYAVIYITSYIIDLSRIDTI